MRAEAPRDGGWAPRCPVCRREIPTFLYLRRGQVVGCDGCVEPVDLWDAPRRAAETDTEKEVGSMEELYELLEHKLREIIAKKEELEIKEIKDAAAILRELRDMEAPENAAGGVVELGAVGPAADGDAGVEPAPDG